MRNGEADGDAYTPNTFQRHGSSWRDEGSTADPRTISYRQGFGNSSTALLQGHPCAAQTTMHTVGTWCREEERRWRAEDLEQRALDNARQLWARFVEKNRRDVEERAEQLKGISNLAALVAGFVMISYLQVGTYLLLHISPQVGLSYCSCRSSSMMNCVNSGCSSDSTQMSKIPMCSLRLASQQHLWCVPPCNVHMQSSGNAS